MASRLACIHHLEADTGVSCRRNVPPALGDHGGRDVGQDEASLGVAPDQVAAEETRAAAELEHAGALKLGQEARELVGDRALESGVKLIALSPRAEACRDLGATTGEHRRIQGHDARTIAGASREERGRRPATI